MLIPYCKIFVGWKRFLCCGIFYEDLEATLWLDKVFCIRSWGCVCCGAVVPTLFHIRQRSFHKPPVFLIPTPPLLCSNSSFVYLKKCYWDIIQETKRWHENKLVVMRLVPLLICIFAVYFLSLCVCGSQYPLSACSPYFMSLWPSLFLALILGSGWVYKNSLKPPLCISDAEPVVAKPVSQHQLE